MWLKAGRGRENSADALDATSARPIRLQFRSRSKVAEVLD